MKKLQRIIANSMFGNPLSTFKACLIEAYVVYSKIQVFGLVVSN